MNNLLILTQFEGEMRYNCSIERQTTTGVRSTYSRSNQCKGYLQMATSDSTPKIIQIPLKGGGFVLVDEQDGELSRFSWRLDHPGNPHCYAIRGTSSNRAIRLHREIMSRVIGRDLSTTEIVDHINGDTFDNRRCNLRIATHSQNHGNAKCRKDSVSGIKGIRKHYNKWVAKITKDHKTYHIGMFQTLDEARAAYKARAIELYGEFARFE